MDNPVFLGLLDRMNTALKEDILNLKPDDTAGFQKRQNQRELIKDIQETLKADVFIGKKAERELTGETTKVRRL